MILSIDINTNHSVQHYSFIWTKSNSSKYCYVSITIQLDISHLFTLSEIVKEFNF